MVILMKRTDETIFVSLKFIYLKICLLRAYIVHDHVSDVCTDVPTQKTVENACHYLGIVLTLNPPR